MTMPSSGERGLAAEHRVATVLVEQGWEMLEHRWHCRHGEMDLLLHRNGQLLIVEVKCRNTAGLAFVGGPGNCLSWQQQRRLGQAFGLWLQEAPQWSHCEVTMGLAVVCGQQIIWVGLENAVTQPPPHLD